MIPTSNYIYTPFFAAIQIHYSSHSHWVTSGSLGGTVQLYDSLAGRQLTSSMEQQLAQIYVNLQQPGGLLVKQVSVQQQIGGADCGVFAIAFAYHAARGDSMTNLHFEQKLMRIHLIKCLEKREFTPFPKAKAAALKQARKNILVQTYCLCRMPESFDTHMVACDKCNKWYYYKCVNIISATGTFICNKCMKCM